MRDHPAQNARFRHLLTLEFYTDNLDLDDWSRALEGPYDEAAARRYVRFEHTDAGFGNLKTRILDHNISPSSTRQRKRLPVIRRQVCNDCEKRRVCFQIHLHGRKRWACVQDCADSAWQRGWRIVNESAAKRE